MAGLKLKGVSKTFNGTAALKGVDLEIRDGEFFVLLGPTGAGKTTSLRCIAGLESLDEGEIELGGEVVNGLPPALRDVAMVFQYYTLYPHLNVRENLAFPLRAKMRKLSSEEIESRVISTAKVLRIEDKLNHRATELSGGEMQRVGIGRAIVRQPRLFLMDEPLSNLDAKLREGMRSELARLHNDMGATFLYVTHDQVEAMTLADRIGVLSEGRILQVGTPDEIYNRPAAAFIASFVGSPQINLLPSTVRERTLGIKSLGISAELTETQKTAVGDREEVLFGIRPEDVRVARESGSEYAGVVRFKQSMGPEDVLNISSGTGTIRAMAEPREKFIEGEKVFFAFDAERSHLFDSGTGGALGSAEDEESQSNTGG